MKLSPMLRNKLEAMKNDLYSKLKRHQSGDCPLIPEAVNDYSNDYQALEQILNSIEHTDNSTDTPYRERTELIIHLEYNPIYGDDRICVCGHPYDRHFDSYEDMKNVGCKYCGCETFVERLGKNNKTLN